MKTTMALLKKGSPVRAALCMQRAWLRYANHMAARNNPFVKLAKKSTPRVESVYRTKGFENDKKKEMLGTLYETSCRSDPNARAAPLGAEAGTQMSSRPLDGRRLHPGEDAEDEADALGEVTELGRTSVDGIARIEKLIENSIEGRLIRFEQSVEGRLKRLEEALLKDIEDRKSGQTPQHM